MGYAEAVGVYLAFLVDQLTNHSSTICSWHVNNTQLRNTFARQALPMTWDYAESNPLCDSTGSFKNLWERQIKGFTTLGNDACGTASQLDASQNEMSVGKVISTDPPYYDNIGYADLSDFFYVWLRRNQSAARSFLTSFATLSDTQSRRTCCHPLSAMEARAKAEEFFLEWNDPRHSAPRRPAPTSAFAVTIYYAFKQSESNKRCGYRQHRLGDVSWCRGIEAGFSITGTWPMRTENSEPACESHRF